MTEDWRTEEGRRGQGDGPRHTEQHLEHKGEALRLHVEKCILRGQEPNWQPGATGAALDPGENSRLQPLPSPGTRQKNPNPTQNKGP